MKYKILFLINIIFISSLFAEDVNTGLLRSIDEKISSQTQTISAQTPYIQDISSNTSVIYSRLGDTQTLINKIKSNSDNFNTFLNEQKPFQRIITQGFYNLINGGWNNQSYNTSWYKMLYDKINNFDTKLTDDLDGFFSTYDEKSPYYNWNEFSFQTVEQNAQQLENLYTIAKASTNFFNGFFNKNNTTTIAFERPVSSFDIYSGQQSKNYANDYDNPITHAVNKKIIPQDYSFMDFMADYAGGHMRWLSQMFKQQLVLRDNIKAYRSAFKTYDNNFDKYANNNTNLLTSIYESINNITFSNSVPSVNSKLVNEYNDIPLKYGKDFDVNNIREYLTQTSKNFYEAVIEYLYMIQNSEGIQIRELSSLVTNLQEIVASTTEWSEDKKQEIDDKLDEESAEIKGQLDEEGNKIKYEDYLAFKNEFQHFENLSLGLQSSSTLPDMLQLMEESHYYFGDLTIELPAVEVSLYWLREIAYYVRFFVGFLWWGLSFLITQMMFRYFMSFAKNFVDYSTAVRVR